MSGHAGCAWAVKVAPDSGTVEERRDRVRTMARYRDWFAAMDGMFELCPEIREWSKDENPGCAVGMSRNAWACFDNRSAYFPSHAYLADICDLHNCWLDDKGGMPIRTPWNLRLFDIRHPKIRDAFVVQTRDLIKQHGIEFLFLDECHDARWPGQKAGYDVSNPIPGVYGSLGWNDAVKQIMRWLHIRVTINGTFPLYDSAMLDGFYLQNADRYRDLPELLNTHREREFHRSCLQVPVDRSLEFQALVADFPGVSIQEIPKVGSQFSFPPPSVYLSRGIGLRCDGDTIIVG